MAGIATPGSATAYQAPNIDRTGFPTTGQAPGYIREDSEDAARPAGVPPTTISIRMPSPQALKDSPGDRILAHPPQTPWMEGTWHVTHSTLPMWKGKTNVKISYKALPHDDSTPSGTPQKLDDLVEYCKEGSDKVSSVHGISRPIDVGGADKKGWAYSWRGKGWLMIASSHWEVLGWGEVEGNAWVVTYFSSTLFTPAGLDIYSRSASGLSEGSLEEIKEKLMAHGNETLSKLAGELFVVPRS